jgi:hypothetical protein
MITHEDIFPDFFFCTAPQMPDMCATVYGTGYERAVLDND